MGDPHIQTVQDWREFIEKHLATNGFIQDEYGDKVEVEDFWARVEHKKDGKHYPDPRYERSDPEGYRMGLGEFS